MSMGNFIGVVAVSLTEMATNQDTTHGQQLTADRRPSGTGMAHLTVVPTNFDPDESQTDRD